MKLTISRKSWPFILSGFVVALTFASVFKASGDPYSAIILLDNPAAYYRLEELPGAVTADDATGNFPGTYVYSLDTNGVPDYPQLGLPGIDTNSILFHPYTDENQTKHVSSVRIPYNAALNPEGPFSAECWVRPTSDPANYLVPLSFFGGYGSGVYANASGWNFYQTPAPASHWVLNMHNAGVFIQSDPLTKLSWYHLAGVYDGTQAVFYVNGVQIGSSVAAGYLANPSADMLIGGGPNTGFDYFDGNVDEVAIYTNVLSAPQILAHYQAGTNSFRAAPTPPSITQNPASITRFAGTPATFSVGADGTAPLSYQWYKGSAQISGATADTLTFITSPGDDGASYSAVVTNSYGTNQSAAATLTVSTNLNILHDPFSITRKRGSMAAFRVVAEGALPITYQWYKNDIFDAIPGATNDTLWLSDILESDDGSTYFATVSNPYTSSDSTPATLNVEFRAIVDPLPGCTYDKVVVGDRPVTYWRLDEPEGSGIAADSVGSFDGSYAVGAGTFVFGAPTGIPHQTDPALGVAGGAVVTIPYALELNPVTDPWSAEAWIKADSLASNGNDFRTVFSSIYNKLDGTHINGWNLYQHAANAWTLVVWNGTGGNTFISDFPDIPIVAGSWYHVVITYDNVTFRLYVNGILRASAVAPFSPNGINGDSTLGGGATVLGWRSDRDFQPFSGSIDDVAFYNKALTPQQVQAHSLATFSLTLVRNANDISLSWLCGKLQSAETVDGSYSDVVGATSPFMIQAGGTQKFYRIQVQ